MIAKNVDKDSEHAKSALQSWRENWYKATFGGEERTGQPMEEPKEEQVVEMLAEFGNELVEMARSALLWRTQADALSKTSYAGVGGSGKDIKGKDMMNAWRKSDE